MRRKMYRWIEKILEVPAMARPGEVNYSLVDRFTLVHFAIGTVYGSIGFSFPVVAFLAILWELVENPLKINLPFIFPHPTADTLQNAIGDVCAVILGWSTCIFMIKPLLTFFEDQNLYT